MATNNKYDRQLRLWGAKGQQALGDTKVILIGASAAGTESLKNLVLPGIGSFCVVDPCSPSKADAASNFFLSPSEEKSRAQVACEYLQELNPDVQGAFHDTVSNLSSISISDWKSVLISIMTTTSLEDNSSSKKFLVIGSDLEPLVLERLSGVCANDLQIPMIVVQSYGLMGVVRLQLTQPTALLDPKPTNEPPDLRLKTSFPGLEKMAESIDLVKLENHQHSHVPYIILLLTASKEWKQTHGGNLPGSFAEKQEFKDFLKSKSRNYDMELNFQEAVQNSYLAYTERDVVVPEHLDAYSPLGNLYQALLTFMDQHQGRPPLNGSIPDMTANTDWYVQLQQIYKDQAEQDLNQMLQLVGNDIPKDDLASFCANVYTVSQMQTSSVVQEWNQPPNEEIMDDLKMALMDPYEVPEHTPLLWYLGVRACQVFVHQHQRYPGTTEEENWESDIPLLQECWKNVAQHYGLEDQELVQSHGKNICHEMTRYANAEIHTIASVVGGVASQEGVKIITGQYIPLDNTYIFNGIVAVGGVYRF